MAVLSTYLLAVLASMTSLVASKAQFSGNFEVSQLVISAPSEASKSTQNSSLTFIFNDQDKPNKVNCDVQWLAGQEPPSQPSPTQCSDPDVGVFFQTGTYNGTTNFLMSLTHTYEDDSIGPPPYNLLTKIGSYNFTYPTTQYYDCDTSQATCHSEQGQTIVVVVTQTVA